MSASGRGGGVRGSIRLQLLALFGLLLVTSAGILVLDTWSDLRGIAAQRQLTDESLTTLRRIKAVSDAYTLDITDTAFKVRNGLMGWEQGVRAVETALIRIRQHWSDLQAVPRSPEQQSLFTQISAARIDADAGAERLIAVLRAGDIAALGRFCDVELFPALDPVTTRLKFLSDLQMIAAEAVVRDNLQRSRTVAWVRVGALSLAFLVVALVGRVILRNIYRGVESLTLLARRMRGKDFEAEPPFRPRGELGTVMDAFLGMRADILGFETELTESLRRNEQVLATLEQRDLFQRSLLSAAQTAILAVDARGRFTHVNPFAERLLGYRAEQLVGRSDPPRILDPSDMREQADRLSAELGTPVKPGMAVLEALARHGLPPREWWLVRADGARVPVLLALSAMQDEDGTWLGLLAVATDLTTIKQLESGLRDSEARAHEASRAKSAFLAAMSHEIRTPMIGVTGMIEVLSHSRLDEDQRRSLNIIQHSAQALLQIVGDILDFSKIEAGKLELAPQAASLPSLVANTVHNYMGTASSKGLELSFEIDPALAPAHRVDPVRLRQILSNLLSNAIKFTEHGSVRARLERLGSGAVGERLRLSVQDTGIGIDEATRARLFQPFAQAEAATSQRFGGTGLGLAICRRLADLMGGELRMDSSPGVGTTLSLELELPLARVEDIEGGTAPDLSPLAPFVARPLPSHAQAEAERSLVLLVDDHPTNRLVIARQLALAGFACETAEDGEAGLAAWRSGRYALVLSDVHMPKLDGYGMARAIRTEEETRGGARTPIIALTAAAMKGEAERCMAAGMDDYLAKPVGIATLVERLRRWLPHLDTPPPRLPDGSAAPLPQAARPPPLDRSVLRQLAAGDPAVERDVLDDFLQATRAGLDALAQATAAADAPALAREAHKLKGASRLVGATELAEAAEALEQAARTAQWPQILALRPDVATAFERLQLFLGPRGGDAPAG